MPLQVLPAAGAADMYRCAVIERRAYATYPASKILFPGPLPADVLTKRGKELEARCEQPDSFFFKVVDTESESEEEQMIAFSIWYGSFICAVVTQGQELISSMNKQDGL